MVNSEMLQAEDVCVLAERDEFDDMMTELMDGAAGAACILTDKHETSVDGRVVCTSHTHRLTDRLTRLSDLQTDENMRSCGVGTAHMTRLLEVIRDEDAAVALFFEIQSRREAGLTADERSVRERRGRFYERLGAVAWDGVVLIPRSFSGAAVSGASLAQMEMLWIPLCGVPTANDVQTALRCIIMDVGNVDPDHPLVAQVMSQRFPDGIPQHLS